MENTKEIDIEYDGKPAKVKIKELTFGELNYISDATNTIKFIGKEPQVTTSLGKMKVTTLLKGIVDAPFPHATEGDIENISARLGNKILQEIESFNAIPEEKKDVSDGP
jgi:hypothetical protein